MLNPIIEVNTIYQVPQHTLTHTRTWREAKCEVCELGYILILGKGSIIHLKQGFNWALEKGNNPSLKSSSFSFSPEVNPLARIKTPACLFPLVWTSEQFLARMRLNVKLPRLSLSQHLLEEPCRDCFAILFEQLLYTRGGVGVESPQSILTPRLISLH